MAHPRIQRDLRTPFVVLFGLVALAAPVLGFRLFMLTVVHGATLADRAEERLDTERLLPTWRGRLLDRKGRVLAEDVASYDAAVSYEFANGSWARARAADEARAALGKSAWRKLSARDREGAIDAREGPWRERSTALTEVLAVRGGVSREELQRRLDAIAKRIDARAASVHERAMASRAKRGLSVDVTPEPIREMREYHTLLNDIPAETANELRKVGDEMPGGLKVVDAARRNHPWQATEVEVARDRLPRPIRTSVPLVMKLDDPLDGLVGSVRDEVWEADLKRRPFERQLEDGTVEIDLGGYRAQGDWVGSRGFERRFEDDLRGLRGQVTRRLDTDEEDRTAPTPGADVRVTIDAQLQMRVQAALDPRLGLTRVQSWQSHSDGLRVGDILPAAAVIVDVASGDVLAAASSPRPEDGKGLNAFVLGADSSSMQRALEGAYPPGSIVKPLVFLAGVAEGVIGETEAVACNGHFFPDRKDVARCWIYRQQYQFTTHSQRVGGPLVIEDALARSCNIYFYTVAQRLGAQRLCKWYRLFGLGTLGGNLLSDDAAAKIDQRRDTFAAISLGIGQGPLTVTPLELANAYAIIGRGGATSAPAWRRNAAPSWTQLPLPAGAVARALEGLRRVAAESYGTAHHMEYGDGSRDPIIDAPGVRVWAKTGTAEAPPLRLDRDGDGTAEGTFTDADHAWCVALVGDEGSPRPRYAIAVLVEHGGGGGRTSGPVMAAVIRALSEEGYLGASSHGASIPVQIGASQ